MPGLKATSCLTALAVLCASAWLVPATGMGREKANPPHPAAVEIHTGRAGCSVDLDSGPVSTTGEGGVLTLGQVEPGEHYLHVSCPDGKNTSLLITASPGEVLRVTPDESPSPSETGLEIVERQMQLRGHIQNAARLRARGRIDEAAEHLREARRLDPENSDLHRELGITFLLGKEWRRARIEMLEAIRSDPSDAEAHNGLAYALEKMGRIDEAVKAYRMASKLDPSDTSYRRQYFSALAKQAAQQVEQKKN